MSTPRSPQEFAQKAARDMAARLANFLQWQRENGRLYYLPSIGETLSRQASLPPATALPQPSKTPKQAGVAYADPENPQVRPPSRVMGAGSQPLVDTPQSKGPLRLRNPQNNDSSRGDQGPTSAPAPQDSIRKRAQSWSAARKLQYLQQEVLGDCQRCALSQTRQHLVFGVGNPEATLMFVGEAPGAEEDRRGEPFVGAAGQRLNRWLAEFQMSREDVYIANVLKCRPPRNRDPEANEIALCSGFLRAQIRAISPQVLVALGRFAGALLLGRPGMRMYEMRGHVHDYRDPKLGERVIPVVVTYHPSYILRRERDESSFGGGEVQRCADEIKVLDDLQCAISAKKDDARS